MQELSEEELAHFRARLEALREQLRQAAEAGEEAGATVELDQSRVGRLSRMDALQGQAMAQAGEQRRRLSLARIEAALQRMEEGEYGWCLSCGELIARGRLEVDPAATQCIDCAAKHETEHQGG